MRKLLKHWPAIIYILECIFTIIASFILDFTGHFEDYDSMGVAIICFWIVLPVTVFITTLYYGITLNNFKKWLLVLLCTLAYIVTYALNQLQPDILLWIQVSVYCFIPALSGMIIGSLIKLIRNRFSGDRNPLGRSENTKN